MTRPPTPKRLGIVIVLVISMMLTLFARLYYVQLLDPHKPVQTAQLRHQAAIVIPAPRGLIVDAYGRPLVSNTTQQVITVDRDALLGRADQGKPMLRRLGALLHTSASKLAKEITPCSTTVPAPCSTGEPYAPVQVATNVPVRDVLTIKEHRNQFPGVEVETVSVPRYVRGSLAAHLLGYPSEVTAADEKRDPL